MNQPVPARGGSTYWIRGPKGIDAADLAREAALRGILIEPVADCFAAPNPQRNVFRMGVTGLPAGKVRAGVAALSEVLRAPLVASFLIGAGALASYGSVINLAVAALRISAALGVVASRRFNSGAAGAMAKADSQF